MSHTQKNKAFLEAHVVEQQMIASLKSTKETVFFAAAFCKAPVFERLAVEAKHVPKKSIIVRWSPEDLIRGVSDLEAYKVAKEHGWQFFINLRLHAKVYLFDNQTAIIGSSNLTERGLGSFPPNANTEMSYFCHEIDEHLTQWKDTLLEVSCLMDDALFKKISDEITLIEDEALGHKQSQRFSSELMEEINARTHPKLLTTDFPWCASPENILASESADSQHDRDLLGLPAQYSLDDIRARFAVSKPFIWLSNNCVNEIYFGELTARLHDSLQDDPRPYRKTVKGLLKNLIDWTTLLYPEQFVADEPSHSTRIRRIVI